ncbi:MAG: DNA-binding protein [Candidatus Omnitrophica bacterium]|nr:DNA-binding protein [Candidatus Omnitrophota bacterium]
MRKAIYIYVLIGLTAWCGFASAEPVCIKDLIKDGSAYDGKRIELEGEVIGHLMKRGDFAWFNISDGNNAMGVWTTYDAANAIQYLGRHAVNGDFLLIEGVFHLKCPGHGGDTDIHADKITVLKSGGPRVLTYDDRKINIIIFLTAILICLYIIKILKRSR